MIAPASHGERDQRAGLQTLQPRDLTDVGEFAFGVDVDHLTADHAVPSGRMREARNEFAAHVRVGMRLAGRRAARRRA